MKSYTATEAVDSWTQVLAEAQNGIVIITIKGMPSVQMKPFDGAALEQYDHRLIDILKHKISCEILTRFSVQEIKDRSLHNIERWRAQGTFGQAYEDWLEILLDEDHSTLITAMVGNSDRSNQLRQSFPYTGMLDDETVITLRDAVSNQR